MAGWSTVTIAGKAVLIHEPPIGPRSGVLFLLDEAQPPFSVASFRNLVENSSFLWLFAFPEESWWCDTPYAPFHSEITPIDFVRIHLTGWLRNRLGSFAPIALGGTTVGGHAALKLAIRSPDEFPIVFSFDAAIDLHEFHGQGLSLDRIYDTSEKLRQQSAPLFLHAYPFPEAIWMVTYDESPWQRGNDRLHEKLNVLGALHHYEVTTEAYDSKTIDSLRSFLEESLNKPARKKLL